MVRRDDLLSGKSYFLVEVDFVGELLDSAAGGPQHLFIIDEIFRGTNTRERVAASAAVLEYLNRGDHVCLVATHDLELIELLGPDWVFRHFSEEITAQEMRFDYRLREGVSSAPNAIRLLEASGFPKEVVDSALRNYDRLNREGQGG